jgi:hypothetical protein
MMDISLVKDWFFIYSEYLILMEYELLVKILNNKFDLDCNYLKHTNGYRIYIFSNYKDKLLSLIKPYLLNHFYYKFEPHTPPKKLTLTLILTLTKPQHKSI